MPIGVILDALCSEHDNRIVGTGCAISVVVPVVRRGSTVVVHACLIFLDEVFQVGLAWNSWVVASESSSEKIRAIRSGLILSV